VGHQYLGSIGKDDNGQVAVTAALSALDYYCPVAMELFMPKDWEEDKDRRSKAGIPPQRTHLTKADMALQLIKGFGEKCGIRWNALFLTPTMAITKTFFMN
jgi:SRSO17 transposase